MNPTLQFVLILVCIAGSAFFSGIETGVISIQRTRLKHYARRGSKRARLLEAFQSDSDRLLGTTLVGTNLCVVMCSVLGASMGRRFSSVWGETAATAVMTVVLLIIGEYLPKAWFHNRPFDRSRRFVNTLRVTEILLTPISAVILRISRTLMPGSDRTFLEPTPFVTRDDLKVLAREGERDGVLSPRERVMIHRVFELSGKPASQIMVPREQMAIVNYDTTITEFFDIARQIDNTRMPVYDREKKTFTGILNVFFVLSYIGTNSTRPIGWFGRPALFVSAQMPVDDILPLMRRHRQPMALVQDDAGEVVGLLTTEDILEEVVGKL